MVRSAADYRCVVRIATTIERLETRPIAAPQRTLCVAPTLDAEVSEIARRMIQAHDNGRPWREMGVLVRSETTYVPALRSAFQRFGIPSRFYFSAPLEGCARGSLLSAH